MSKGGMPGYAQDWNTVTINKKPAAPTGSKEQQANKLRQQGQSLETVAKFTAGNKVGGAGPSNARKIDEETENFKHKEIGLDVRRAIASGRQAKSMTQKDLAVLINEQASVVTAYEAGKAIPNNNILQKMEKHLGVKLRGTGIGTPIEAKVPKAAAKPGGK
jgi:putative transcription factor